MAAGPGWQLGSGLSFTQDDRFPGVDGCWPGLGHWQHSDGERLVTAVTLAAEDRWFTVQDSQSVHVRDTVSGSLLVSLDRPGVTTAALSAARGTVVTADKTGVQLWQLTESR